MSAGLSFDDLELPPSTRLLIQGDDVRVVIRPSIFRRLAAVAIAFAPICVIAFALNEGHIQLRDLRAPICWLPVLGSGVLVACYLFTRAELRLSPDLIEAVHLPWHWPFDQVAPADETEDVYWLTDARENATSSLAKIHLILELRYGGGCRIFSSKNEETITFLVAVTKRYTEWLQQRATEIQARIPE